MQKRRWMTFVGVLVAILSLALFAAACGDDDDDNGADPTAVEQPTGPVDQDEPTEPADGNGAETSIAAGLTDDFVIAVSEDSAAAGAVTFDITNNGALPHDFKVAKSDAGRGELPQDAATGVVDETQVDVVAATVSVLAGESEELPAELEAGSYVLFCNVPGHYAAGMETAFTVN